MNRSAILIFLCLITTDLFCATPSDTQAPTADVLLNRIRNEGAAAVIASLWDKPAWADLTNHVASGKPKWVDVAIAISPGSDAGATEELQDALFVGLGQNPAYELKVLPMEEANGIPLSLSTICSGRGDPLGTYSASIAELRAVEAAVLKVSMKSLQTKRWKCLAEMKAGEANLKRFFEAP